MLLWGCSFEIELTFAFFEIVGGILLCRGMWTRYVLRCVRAASKSLTRFRNSVLLNKHRVLIRFNRPRFFIFLSC